MALLLLFYKVVGEVNLKTAIHINNFNSNYKVFWPKLDLKPIVGKPEIMPRPEGYRLKEYKSVVVKTISDSFTCEGFSDALEAIAEDKAISESLERFVMQAYALQTQTPDTSNGWACHFSIEGAIQNALSELVERDVAITSWENGKPFYLIPESAWPISIINWYSCYRGRLEYSELKIGLSQSENGCSVSTFLFNEARNCVAAHSSKTNLREAIMSSFMECLRAAHSAVRLENFSDVIALHKGYLGSDCDPGAHSLAYAYTFEFPKNIAFIENTVQQIDEKWKLHQLKFLKFDLSKFEVLAFNILDRVAVRLRHSSLKQIYWGTPKNWNELTNKHPHTVG